MATALSTTGAELIGFQNQLCRVSHQPTPFRTAIPSYTQNTPWNPLGPYSRQPLDGDHGRAATPLQSPSRRRSHCKCRLYCIFHEVSFVEFGTMRVGLCSRYGRGRTKILEGY